MGLRIAILMGLHREGGTSRTRSERIHCNRLWWTIYMQERYAKGKGKKKKKEKIKERKSREEWTITK